MWVVTGELETGLAVYLALAAIIQVAVVALTVAGVRGPSYLTEGRLTKTGSGLLHLGFILFGIVVVALQKSTWMLPVFSAAALLSIVGTALSFYASRLAWHRSGPHEEAAVRVDRGCGCRGGRSRVARGRRRGAIWLLAVVRRARRHPTGR